jgi:hypothetical protein
VPTNYVALVAAGLFSVIVFPPVAIALLRGRDQEEPIGRNVGDAAQTAEA